MYPLAVNVGLTNLTFRRLHGYLSWEGVYLTDSVISW